MSTLFIVSGNAKWLWRCINLHVTTWHDCYPCHAVSIYLWSWIILAWLLSVSRCVNIFMIMDHPGMTIISVTLCQWSCIILAWLLCVSRCVNIFMIMDHLGMTTIIRVTLCQYIYDHGWRHDNHENDNTSQRDRGGWFYTKLPNERHWKMWRWKFDLAKIRVFLSVWNSWELWDYTLITVALLTDYTCIYCR